MTGAESSKELMYPRLKFDRIGTGNHTFAILGYVLEPVDAAK
jgi:hypothetical protein